MSLRPRIYIGGPLTGQPVAARGEFWARFRDDRGEPIPDQVGDAMLAVRPAEQRQHYYWASLPGGGGLTYVHLSEFDHYLGACAWAAVLAAAEEATRMPQGAAAG